MDGVLFLLAGEDQGSQELDGFEFLAAKRPPFRVSDNLVFLNDFHGYSLAQLVAVVKWFGSALKNFQYSRVRIETLGKRFASSGRPLLVEASFV